MIGIFENVFSVLILMLNWIFYNICIVSIDFSSINYIICISNVKFSFSSIDNIINNNISVNFNNSYCDNI